MVAFLNCGCAHCAFHTAVSHPALCYPSILHLAVGTIHTLPTRYGFDLVVLHLGIVFTIISRLLAKDQSRAVFFNFQIMKKFPRPTDAIPAITAMTASVITPAQSLLASTDVTFSLVTRVVSP